MKEKNRRPSFRGGALAVLLLVSSAGAAQAQLSGTTDNDLSQKSGTDSECATAKNPVNPNQVFAFCNTTGAGMFAARSTDGGATWFYPDPDRQDHRGRRSGPGAERVL